MKSEKIRIGEDNGEGVMKKRVVKRIRGWNEGNKRVGIKDMGRKRNKKGRN